MTPEWLFSALNAMALTGWVALAFAPLAPKSVDLLSGWVLPGAMALVYSVLMLVHFADAPGGFGTLGDVQALFTDPEVALAGWVHFLAFDLFIGAWILRDARSRGIAHWTVLPIMPFVFLLGPAGLLAYLSLCLVLRVRLSRGAEVKG